MIDSTMASTELSDDLIGQYYVKTTTAEQGTYARGQMYYCPCLYLDSTMRVLHPRGIDPYDQKPPLFESRPLEARHFNDAPHKPLLKPRLRADEEIVALVAKKRPVIIMSSKCEPWPHRGGGTRDECLLVAPLYSFDPEDSPEFRLRMRAYSYRELFYLPEKSDLHIRESYVRFDRMHSAPRSWLSRRRVSLHQDALDILTDWYHFFLTGVMEEYLTDYRSELQRALANILSHT